MRYSPLFKLLALLLCAASLLGIAASGLGIFAMAECGLYNRSVEEYIDEKIRIQGESLAHSIAGRYASTELGGIPEQMAREWFPDHFYGTFNSNLGYILKDSEGNVLVSSLPEGLENARMLTFPVTGQYLHLVSSMTEEEKYRARPAESQDSVYNGEGLYISQNIPVEGSMINRCYIEFTDGTTLEHSAEDNTAFGAAFLASDGSVFCVFDDTEIRMPENTPIQSIILTNFGINVYTASSGDGTGIGYITNSATNMGQVFRSTVKITEPEDVTVPETSAEETAAAEATVPAATVPQTVPETTVPETTVPETVPFTPAQVRDNIPTDGIAEVIYLNATLSGGKKISREDEFGLGRVRHKGEDVLFTSYEPWETETGAVTHILLRGENGKVLYEASHEEGVGKLSDKDGQISFRSAIPQPPPPPTVPETEPPMTTVPETTPVTDPPVTEETYAQETIPGHSLPGFVNGKPLEEYDLLTDTYFDPTLGQQVYVEYVFTPMPEYTMDLYLTEDSLNYEPFYDILRTLQTHKAQLLPLLGASILVFILSAIYLVHAAGRKSGQDQCRAGGLNRIPLDLYLVTVGLGIPCLCVAIFEGSVYLMRQDMTVGIACGLGCGFAACLLTVGFLFALVAQCRTPGGFWWRNTLCGHCIRLFFRFAVWLESAGRERFFPALGRAAKSCWKLTCRCLVWSYRTCQKLFRGFARILETTVGGTGRMIHRFLVRLPVTWQWLACGFGMFLLIGICFAANGEEVLVVLTMGLWLALIVYGAHCFGNLLDSTRKMGQGDLHAKADDRLMVGAFREFAAELNRLAGVAIQAAQKQLKSERMKTELITNVSHDIKTPLTSIINYVDLLQKPHTEEEGRQYLEVLSRQSQQLKKLLEDLMDMSKASTGNMTVEISRLDAVEAVNQALGEFAGKLEKADLIPVFRHTEPSLPIMADGRLLWRVISNLLGNTVKYAMPGTRVYLDLLRVEDRVVLSIKNVSRDELNLDASELMERFVRGDGSRNTEGSGLGLNIAKSLAELQKGQMELLIDGDLFKVTLDFPGA